MTRKVNLRNHINTLCSSISYNLANLILSVPHALTIRHSVMRREILLDTSSFTNRANLCKTWVLLDLNSPTLVLSKMPVELIEFIYLHDIKITLNLFNTEEMTSLIKMKTTISETWSIRNSNALHSPRSLRSRCSSENLNRKKLLDGLDSIVESTKTRSLNTNHISFHVKCVSLSWNSLIVCKHKTCLCSTGSSYRSSTTDCSKFISKGLDYIYSCLIKRLLVCDRSTLSIKSTLAYLHFVWIRDYIQNITLVNLSCTSCS